jgi:hypothetical protein
MIKVIATAASLMTATTVSAQDVRQVPIVGHCSMDFGVFEDVYGSGLSPIHEPLKNAGGFGIVIMENQKAQVGMLFIPNGAMCVIWDNVLEGDPA